MDIIWLQNKEKMMGEKILQLFIDSCVVCNNFQRAQDREHKIDFDCCNFTFKGDSFNWA